MKRLRLLLGLSLAATAGMVWADNQPATEKAEQKIEIDSDSGYYDGVANQMVYIGHVFVTDYKNILTCERLTVDLPPSGGSPTNIVAETNVVVDAIDQKGQTNHITADKAIYSYSEVTNPPVVTAGGMPSSTAANVVTNQQVLFTGGDPMPKVDGPHGTILAEPLILDIAKKKFEMPGRLKMILKQPMGSGGGTNASPFSLLK